MHKAFEAKVYRGVYIYLYLCFTTEIGQHMKCTKLRNKGGNTRGVERGGVSWGVNKIQTVLVEASRETERVSGTNKEAPSYETKVATPAE